LVPSERANVKQLALYNLKRKETPVSETLRVGIPDDRKDLNPSKPERFATAPEPFRVHRVGCLGDRAIGPRLQIHYLGKSKK
jgi:hypothetical protein